MKTILALLLIVAGGWLVYLGYNRADSIAGRTQSAITDLKNEIDGKPRVSDHVKFYAGGALLVMAGAILIARRK